MRYWGIALAALSMTVGCSRGEEASPVRTPPPDAKRVDTSRAGRVSGRVLIDGPLPRNPAVDMKSDAVCVRQHREGATFDTFSGEDGGLGDVFVYVKDGLEGYFFETPSQPVTLDQKGCQYVPHVFGVQVGQTVEFVNSDPTLHTVQSASAANAEFNFSQPIQGQRDTKFFSEPEVMVRFRCNVHTWMSAYAGVLEHPYFAVTKPAGQFELKDLPPGTYTVQAWHEKLGTREQKITLGEKETRELSFTFKAPAAP